MRLRLEVASYEGKKPSRRRRMSISPERVQQSAVSGMWRLARSLSGGARGAEPWRARIQALKAGRTASRKPS
jgi:hypothetical protein